MNILIIGGGGREHAIAHKLKQSPLVDKLYCANGNAGIASIATCVDIAPTDLNGICKFVAQHKDIDLVFVAPDDPLAMGLVDMLNAQGVPAYGANKAAALIESSKVFAKSFMKKYNIPTAEYCAFHDYDSALEYLKVCKYPIYVKADGLAVGKGAIRATNFSEGSAALKQLMQDKAFGKAGDSVVIEQELKGFEVSVLAFCDGQTAIPMPAVQDHKQIFEGDLGANTGGMGTYSPVKAYTPQHAARAYNTIILPTIQGMQQEGRPFSGVLFFGLMVDGDDIYVIEYNARFGDPETQVLMQLLQTDLAEIIIATQNKKLKDLQIEFSSKHAVCVIMASEGYPQAYQKGKIIQLPPIDEHTMIYHAGTKMQGNDLCTNGGRVLGVTAIGDTFLQAQQRAYALCQKVSFEGAYYRKDIGHKNK